ncbi:MAG: hypothetical protein MHPSP_003683, partial [Paramarteilia canceri]
MHYLRLDRSIYNKAVEISQTRRKFCYIMDPIVVGEVVKIKNYSCAFRKGDMILTLPGFGIPLASNFVATSESLLK